ncbi:MAG: alpha/beta fold hydrolase [Candidatus Pedobacter colombiensis]|uniref:Alpha/beta fold hydrolase n=1 Tax=Candidatus Pedobacter colombiensis TaxID=3121371 RepID=A0AAJ5WA84_9SPHI|nr:alpha/beta fold hydrolase [Pedobacter sp.]WEK20902.1 MAG: alpha/beta fold hydrolase [Pedobacter sp.]
MRFILKVSQDSLSKRTTAVFDSPDQGAFGLGISKLTITNDSLLAYSAVLKGDFKGKFNADKSELSGKWGQIGKEFDLSFKRVPNQGPLKRPQTPKASFPYSEEKVIYLNMDKTIQYGATLTVPPSVKGAPVVILITGSGQEDRDETLFGHKPFWVMADHLSRNGIAVLRVDDRGIGQTTGNVSDATSADFAKDVLVGVDYLKSRKDLDLGKIGLIGHSEGGVIAPLAANRSKDIKFIVSLAGVGVKGADLVKRQSRDAYAQIGLNKIEQELADSFTKMMIQLASLNISEGERKNMFKKSMAEWLKQQPDSFLVKLGFKGPNGDDNIRKSAGMFFSPWMRYFVKYDPAPVLSKIQIPFLALNGGKDVQVSAKENLAAFDQLLKQGGNKDVKVVLLPNLNHFFQNAETGKGSEYAIIEETISPEVLDIMTNWILKIK